jgi:hypothetical protein
MASLLDLPGEPAPLGAVAPVLPEQDHAGGLARPEAAADVLGPRGTREARDRDLADLLPERHAIDRLERDGEPLLLRRLLGRRAPVSAGVVVCANAHTRNQGDECAGAQSGKPPPAGRSRPTCVRSRTHTVGNRTHTPLNAAVQPALAATRPVD